jgi:hypothetical protein
MDREVLVVESLGVATLGKRGAGRLLNLYSSPSQKAAAGSHRKDASIPFPNRMMRSRLILRWTKSSAGWMQCGCCGVVLLGVSWFCCPKAHACHPVSHASRPSFLFPWYAWSMPMPRSCLRRGSCYVTLSIYQTSNHGAGYTVMYARKDLAAFLHLFAKSLPRVLNLCYNNAPTRSQKILSVWFSPMYFSK